MLSAVCTHVTSSTASRDNAVKLTTDSYQFWVAHKNLRVTFQSHIRFARKVQKYAGDAFSKSSSSLLGNLQSCFFLPADFFFKSAFSKYYFRNIIRVSSSWDPDQAMLGLIWIQTGHKSNKQKTPVLNFITLLSCQPRVTVTSCFVYKVIRTKYR